MVMRLALEPSVGFVAIDKQHIHLPCER
jgi:hypothetical protein